MNIDDAFAKLLGRQATDEERMRLYRTRDALGLKDNDALWLVLIALQSHQAQYDEMPRKIEDATLKILANAKKTAETEMMGTAVKIHGELVQSVSSTAREVANSVAGKSMAQWALGAFAGAAVVILGALWFGHNWGYNAAKNEAAAVSAWMTTAAGQRAWQAFERDADRAEWAGTREARAAYLMSRNGSLAFIVDCNQPGWTTEKKNGTKFCYPFAVKGGNVYGWEMP